MSSSGQSPLIPFDILTLQIEKIFACSVAHEYMSCVAVFYDAVFADFFLRVWMSIYIHTHFLGEIHTVVPSFYCNLYF